MFPILPFVRWRAQASVLIIPQNDEVKIPVDKAAGTLVQMPFSVKTITPALSFDIRDVASDVDLGTGAKMDVRLFQIRPLAGAKSEHVTFVLGNGKTVQVHLIPSEDGEKHFDLVFPADLKKHKDPRFLQPEIGLMRAMILDAAGRGVAGDFARQITNESVTLKHSEGLSAKLVRVFAAQGLVGYAFEIRNSSGASLKLNVSGFSLGENQNNTAVLVHAEKEVLESCGFISTPNCKTRLLLVTRGEVSKPRSLTLSPGFPYIRSHTLETDQGGEIK